MTNNGDPHQVWCICCKQVVTVGPETVLMKTAYHLTATGPISYGCCDECLRDDKQRKFCKESEI